MRGVPGGGGHPAHQLIPLSHGRSPRSQRFGGHHHESYGGLGCQPALAYRQTPAGGPGGVPQESRHQFSTIRPPIGYRRRRDGLPQILGANTPHTVRSQPAHASRAASEEPYARPTPKPRKSRAGPLRTMWTTTRPSDRRDGGGSRLPIILAIAAVAVFVVGIGVFLWVSFFSSPGRLSTMSQSGG